VQRRFLNGPVTSADRQPLFALYKTFDSDKAVHNMAATSFGGE
jgi:hypothetical protein